MSGGLFNATSIPVVEQAVYFAQARHGVLAGNLANLDTPGYRVRDLSVDEFRERLQEAIDVRKASHAGLPSESIRDYEDRAMQRVRDTMEGILFHDDSNVSIEQQVAEISKNQAEHNTALAILRSQFRLLEAAISERA